MADDRDATLLAAPLSLALTLVDVVEIPKDGG